MGLLTSPYIESILSKEMGNIEDDIYRHEMNINQLNRNDKHLNREEVNLRRRQIIELKKKAKTLQGAKLEIKAARKNVNDG